MIDDTKLVISTVMLGVKRVVNKYGNPEIAPKQMNDELDEVYRTALTAIYEIGLTVIGAADKHEHNEFCNRPCDSDYEEIRNELRGEIQLAWAKACGVAEK